MELPLVVSKLHGILQAMDCWGEALFWLKSTVTLKQNSIGYGIQPVSELEPVLALCRIYNLVVDH